MRKVIFPLLYIIVITQFYSCARIPFFKSKGLVAETVKYSFTDTTGNYQIVRETGLIEKKDETFVKTQLLPESGDEDKALEKSIVISKIGKIKTSDGVVTVLIPKISQYTVWFDGERFFSQMKVNPAEKKLEIILVSPEKKWQGKTLVDLPKDDQILCFFSQLGECIKVTQFLEKSSHKKLGTMNFKIVWDKYPYLQEQLINFPLEVISDAAFSFESVDSEGFLRYELKVAGHSLFYHFDKHLELVKSFWVAQGISQVRM